MNEMEFIQKGKDWLLNNGPDFITNIVIFIIILIAGAIIISGLRKVTKVMLDKTDRINDTLSKFILNVQNKVLWVVVLMVALPRLGVDIAPLIAGLGVTGFIVGFAFQESLGNLASGLMIILNRPFEVGHFVEIGGHAGTVKEINMMAITISTGDNKKIVIPNRSVWGGSITNYSAYDTRRVDMVVGIGYSDDIGKAISVISDVLKSIDQVLPEPTPVIEVVEMADSSINLVVRPWSKTADYWAVYFAAHRKIKEALDAAGVEIPFPQVDVHHHGEPTASVA